jgi:hypothetical protein
MESVIRRRRPKSAPDLDSKEPRKWLPMLDLSQNKIFNPRVSRRGNPAHDPDDIIIQAEVHCDPGGNTVQGTNQRDMNHPRATQAQPPDTWYDGNRDRVGPREPQGNWDRTGYREPSTFRNIPVSPPPFRNEAHHSDNAHPEMFTTAHPSMPMFMTEQIAPSWQYQGTPSTAKNAAAHATDGMDSQGFSTAIPSQSQSTQDDLEFVKAHPVGALFFSILADNTLSAKKNGTKQTHLNVGQISAALKSLERHEEQKVEQSLEKKTAKIEHNLIARDLNATKISLDNPPPAKFASEDQLVTLHKKKDAQLTFPFRHNKFSGNNPRSKDK